MNRLVVVGKYTAIVVLFALQACSSTGDEEGENTVNQPVGPDWIHPACDATSLSPPANNAQLCNGPWKYTYQEWWKNRESCGNDPNVCETFSACASWDKSTPGDGLGFTTTNPEENGPAKSFVTSSCAGTTSIAAICAADAIALRNAKIAERPGISSTALAGFSITSEVRNYSCDDVSIPERELFQFVESYKCHFFLKNLPDKAVAVHPWCPCAQQAPAECPRGPLGTFTSTDVPHSIPDSNAAGVTSVVVVPAGFGVKKVLVNVNITHTFRGNLEISVIAPNGQVAMLSNREGSSADDYVASNLDVTSSFTTGSAASGTWTLKVRDLAPIDVGTINAFSLRIVSSPTIATGYTNPGTDQSSIPGTQDSGSTRRTVVGTPSCTTCDALAADTDTAVQNKFACYDQGIAAETDAVRSSLIARMKLLFQLAGERLSAAQRSRVEALYDEDASSAPACSEPVPWESSCRAQAAPLSLPGQLQLCQDLAGNDRASTGVATAELPHCLDQLAKVKQLSPDTCRLPTRDAADGAAQGVLGKTYPSLAGDLVTLLPPVLNRISAWWTAATSAASGDRSWLLGHANMLLRQLWTNIERAKIPLPTGVLATDTAAAALLADITGTGFSDDFSVLSALFAPGQLSLPPLLTLAGDALQPIADRLGRLEELHDVGCRFAKPACREVAASGSIALTSSATSELVRVLSVLPDRDALTAALTAASHLSSQQPALYAALSRIRDQHGYFTAAWNALGRTDTFLQLATLPEPPAEAAALAAIVRDAAVAWSSYQGSGVFAPWHRARLTTAALQQSALVGFVDGLRSDVTRARGDYEQNRLNTVNDLLLQTGQKGRTQSALDRITALRDQDADLMSRTLGMESREAAERARLAGFQSAFEALITSGALDANAAYQTQTLTQILASAADAHFPGSGAGNAARDGFAAISLHTGESLRLAVTGTWTPTCGIVGAHIQGPESDFIPVTAPDSATGPEGYWVSLSSDSFKAHSVATSNDYRTDVGVEARACMGASLGSNLGWGACVHASFDWIHSNSDSTSNGSNARSSASFMTGLRLPSMPFPEAPAGSLLAVVTVAGHPEQVLDVHVVQRSDLIVAPALSGGQGDQVDIHFVVNALGTCSPASTPNLQIEGVKSIPVGNVARAIGAAMAATLSEVEAQAPAILAQGQLSGEDAAAVRTAAWTRVSQALVPSGIGLAGLPYDLRQLFDNFIEGEIASIARRAQMHAISRERMQLQLSSTAVANELAFSDQQNRLLLLVPRWRLRDLSGVKLAQVTDALAEALSSQVAQIYELRDPAGFTQFRTAVTQQTVPLIGLNLTAAYENTVQTLENFATAARNALAAAPFELPSDFRRTLVVAIPRNPVTCTGGPCTYRNSWTSVSSSAAQAFWAATTAKPFAASITLTPSDLYTALGTGTLACSDTAPVIRRMAMYLDTKTSTIDLRTALLELHGIAAPSGSQVLFPVAGKVLGLEADNPSGVVLSPTGLNGNVNQVSERFGASQAELGTGAGLSPFTKFTFDMTPFQSGIPKDALAVTEAVLLVFEVERRVSTSNAQVPGVCTLQAP